MLNEPFYTVREASQLTRLAYWSIWDLIKRGKIMKTKVAGKTFIRESELKKLVVDVPAQPRPSRKRKVAAALAARQ
jgi:hypothetical protein